MQSSRKVMITRRRRRRSKENRPKIFSWLLRLFIAVVILAALFFLGVTLTGVGTALAIYSNFASELPDPSAIETEQEDFETTKIYDRSGNVLLYELFDPRRGDRTYITFDQIPEACIQATIDLEDKTFYTNPGFDVEGLGRAFWSNIRGGQIQGGSSITQQLIKNIIIDPQERLQRSYTRKLKEVILATEITRRYDKDQVLEWYFNTNHYGNLAYGLEAAAQVYFQKPASALNLAECSMLAAIPQFPFLNPIDSLEDAKRRQGIVLRRMVEEGTLTPEEAELAFKQDISVKLVQERFDIIAPHFSIYVRQELERKFDPDLVYRGGLKVYTTLDLEFNEAIQEIAARHVAELDAEGHNVSNACVVAIRPKTGEILAMVGSVDYWNEEIDGKVNVCTADPGRQPGSSFKPFNYLTAFSQGLTPATMVMDVRQAFPDATGVPYVPENYDRRYHGPVRLRNALQNSYNIPAVWVLEKAGIKNVVNTAHRMGITTLNDDIYGLSLTLGGGEVKPIDMAYAYSVFANMGVMAGQPIPEEDRRSGHRNLDPVAILRVEDNEGNVLYRYDQPTTERIIDPALGYLMVNILSDNNARAPAFGARSSLFIPGRPVGAKTGTTNNFKDNWTIGFTPQLAVAVWVGNNNNEEMKDVTGLSGAAPIWNEVMSLYHQGLPVETWLRPPGLVEVEVDVVSGLLPTEQSPATVRELFLEGTEPKVQDNVHQVYQVNRENGKLAVTGCTPPELIEERVYEIYPPVARDWVKENNIPQPPHDYDDSCPGGVAAGPVAITFPRPYEYVGGGVVITGNARLDGFSLYRLAYGPGLNPTEWRLLGGDHSSPVDGGPLEFWDTAAVDEGLYTLQLTVARGDQSFEQHAVQVTVDNTPPEIEVLNPEPERIYVKEDDEWINIQVDAQDNFAMDRVEYYIDNLKIDESTVSPYNLRWTIAMSDVTFTNEYAITQPTFITDVNGLVTEGPPITLTEVISITDPLSEALAIGYQQIISGGMTIISDTVGYTETHLIHIIAYDAAGNKTESEPIRVFVIHEEEEDEESVETDTTTGARLPPETMPLAQSQPSEPAGTARQRSTPLKFEQVGRFHKAALF
ncbi:MAG: penicillin-binding protein [Anaerolineae bacterium]